MDRCRLFINKIKEHRHDNIKNKHIEKFEKLHFKQYGYHHNINRHTPSFNDSGNDTLSGQPNVPSRFSTRPTSTSTTSSIPVTPMAPHLPPTQWLPMQHLGYLLPAPTPAPAIHVPNTSDKWVINLSRNPPAPMNSYPSSKMDLILPSPLNTPHRSLHNCNRTSIFQATNPGSR